MLAVVMHTPRSKPGPSTVRFSVRLLLSTTRRRSWSTQLPGTMLTYRCSRPGQPRCPRLLHLPRRRRDTLPVSTRANPYGSALPPLSTWCNGLLRGLVHAVVRQVSRSTLLRIYPVGTRVRLLGLSGLKRQYLPRRRASPTTRRHSLPILGNLPHQSRLICSVSYYGNLPLLCRQSGGR